MTGILVDLGLVEQLGTVVGEPRPRLSSSKVI